MTDISPIFDAILKYIPAPDAISDKPLQMLVSNIGYDNYKGRIAIGKIHSGILLKMARILPILTVMEK